MIRALAGVAAATTLILSGGTVSAAISPPHPGSQIQQAGPTAPSPPSPPKPAKPPEPTLVIVPASPASARAAALRSEQLGICIGCSRAEAGPSNHLAHATGIKVGNRELAGGESASGQKRGELYAIPDNPVFRLVVGAWLAQASSGSASAQADLVDLALGGSGEVLNLQVLRSSSRAEWSQIKSTGSSDSDGVRIEIGHKLTLLLLLHSDASSEGKGHVYLVGINDTHLGETTDAPGGVIPINLRPIITVILIQASAAGGVGSSGVGQVTDVGGSSGAALSVLTNTGSGTASFVTRVPTAPVTVPGSNSSSSTATAPRVPAAGIALGGAGFVVLLAGLLTLRAATQRRASA